MKIKVFYPHKTGYVDTSELSTLINKGKIMAFEREHKLAVVGIHPTRKGATKIYPSDRRKTEGKG
jgi:hypothetical protein